MTPPNVFMIIVNLKQNLNLLYNEYASLYNNIASTLSTTSQTSNSRGTFDISYIFLRDMTKCQRTSGSNEKLDRYLTIYFEFSEKEFQDFDILN